MRTPTHASNPSTLGALPPEHLRYGPVGDAPFLVGRGLADITGEAAGCGMLGYGKADQQTEGIHTRQRSRAFVIAQGREGPRLLLVVNELPLVFDSVHQEVLRRLRARYGETYTARNTMITATHTHCAPGGYSHHLLYNSNTKGFRPKTFGALVDGIVEAVDRAHADLAPSRLFLSHGQLHDASVNRSRVAFDRNPEADRAFFPDAIDPQTTLLRIERAGVTVGALNWFATHNTSMTNRNRLISSDNKGYAAYFWEREVEGLDYLTDLSAPRFVGAFAQTNAGDMSPNLNLAPGQRPHRRRVREHPHHRDEAVRRRGGAGRRGGDGGHRARSPRWPSMWIWRTSRSIRPSPATGAPTPPAARPAGRPRSPARASTGPRSPPSVRGATRGGTGPRGSPTAGHGASGTHRRPKGSCSPGASSTRCCPVVAERAPVQLLRLGPLYLIGIPGEVTITAGLRLRRTVAAIVGADIENVLVAGYSNGYIHYVTTPEEYDAQRYEGASTLFGRWELPALRADRGAAGHRHARRFRAHPWGRPPWTSRTRYRRRRWRSLPDAAPPGLSFGDVVVAPRTTYKPGQRVKVTFVGAHPGHDLHRGGTFLEVQRADGPEWRTVADDGDWATRFLWKRSTSADRR